MRKYRFIGKLEYVPFNEREWYFRKKEFKKTVISKNIEAAQLKLQQMLILLLNTPAKRINITYTSKDITYGEENECEGTMQKTPSNGQ